jgi:hypothetical protein
MTNKMQNKTIIIAGDSWGCGEWCRNETDYNDYKISHLGLTQYLLDLGYLVINLSKPGGSNSDSVDRVDNFLTMSTHLNILHVFIFQTEWMRDFRFERLERNKGILVEYVAAGYSSLKMQLMRKFYYELSRISQETKTPIHLIGGCGDTIWLDKFSQEYPGLSVCCQSLTNLLLTGNHRIEYPVHSLYRSENDIEYLKKKLDSKDLELLLDDIDKGSQRIIAWDQQKSFFYPDGVHPNRLGHKILFDFLKTQILNL